MNWYEPQLFRNWLVRERVPAGWSRDARNGVWQDGAGVYYRLGRTEAECRHMIFTSGNGCLYDTSLSR